MSCVTVVTAFIDRCREVNDITNSIVEERYNDAIKEAQHYDDVLASGIDVTTLKKTKPFMGIPFTTKESNEAKGKQKT